MLVDIEDLSQVLCVDISVLRRVPEYLIQYYVISVLRRVPEYLIQYYVISVMKGTRVLDSILCDEFNSDLVKG